MKTKFACKQAIDFHDRMEVTRRHDKCIRFECIEGEIKNSATILSHADVAELIKTLSIMIGRTYDK